MLNLSNNNYVYIFCIDMLAKIWILQNYLNTNEDIIFLKIVTNLTYGFCNNHLLFIILVIFITCIFF